jgi:hypothetical protein
VSKRDRGRFKGRFEAGEHFGAVPLEVLESNAYNALPDYGARVLLAIAANYRGINNGNLSLTRAEATSRGVKSSWMVSAALELLMVTGLLHQTREGKNSGGHYFCSLYALGWRPINPTPQAYPAITQLRPAPNKWESWERPENWVKYTKELKRSMSGEKRTWSY